MENPRKVLPQDWGDTVFCRGQEPFWFVENKVDGEIDRKFPNKDDAVLWVSSQINDRHDIELWARVIDQRLWSDFDKDQGVRHGFLYDEIFASLREAKRIRAALSNPPRSHNP